MWHERFMKLFCEIASPLAVVLNAASCREGWLQGEFYRHFHPTETGFNVNCKYGRGHDEHKYDLVCDRPTDTTVAELKVYGLTGYCKKNLFGKSNISRFVPKSAGVRLCMPQEEIEELEPEAELKRQKYKEWKRKHREWSASYLADVLRLHRLPEELEKYMVLVLHKSAEPDEFGKAISAVQVSRSEWEWECKEFMVRVSRLYGNKGAV